jgi:hypothetical protein
MSSGERELRRPPRRTPRRRAIQIDLDDLNSERDYDPFVACGRSKLANLLFSYELQRRRPTSPSWPYTPAWSARTSAIASPGGR